MKKITILIIALFISLTSYAQFPESSNGGAQYNSGAENTHSWFVNDINDYAPVRSSEAFLPAEQLTQDRIFTSQVSIPVSTDFLTYDMTDFSGSEYNSEMTVRVSTEPIQTNIGAFFTTVFRTDELQTNDHVTEGNNEWVGPVTYSASGFDCSTYTLPFFEDFSNANAFTSCYVIEDANADNTSWGYNGDNDFDGDTVPDPVTLVFPPNPSVDKDDWLFLPIFNGTANTEYELTIVYNVFDNPITGSESFDIVALDSPSSTATTQSVVGSFNGITQSGAGIPNLLPNAYTSSVIYTPTADGDFYLAIHATTPMASSGILLVFNLSVDETLGVNDFEQNSFNHNYNKNLQTLNLENINDPITSVEIYSLLGQRVLYKSLSNTTESIDVSNLKTGIYVANVSINGNSKTIKFVKN